MNKATHKGRLKSAKYIANKFDRGAIGKEFALYLIENEGQIRELKQFGNNDTRYFDGDMCVIDDYFTDLQEIKKEIEIPKCPFWIDYGSDDIDKIIPHKGRKNRLMFERTGNDYLIEDFEYHINNGTWKIVDEPKKKMRPWNDEEWKEWFLNDGVLVSILHGSLSKPILLSMISKCEFMKISKNMLSYSYVISKFTDRHGNKFEKENL
jgi:hypothetical protein